MMPEPEENRLDQSLRSKFDDYELTPGAPVWAGIEQRLTPPPRLRPRRRPWLVPLLLVLTAAVAGLGGWLLPHGLAVRPEVASRAAGRRLPQFAPPTADKLAPAPQNLLRPFEATVSGRRSPVQTFRASTSAPQSSSQKPGTVISERRHLSRVPAVATSAPSSSQQHFRTATPTTTAHFTPADTVATAMAAVAAEEFPVTLRSLAGLERQTLVQLPSLGGLVPAATPVGNHAALLTTLRAERAELFRLQRRTDSLLLVLGDLPAAPHSATADTAQLHGKQDPTPKTNRWSLLLTATPEQNTLALQGHEGDSLTALRRNHETGRAGFSASLLAEYKLTPRLSVGGGVGYTALGADVRITNKTTDVRVRYDSTTTHLLNVFTSTHQTYSIRIVQMPQLSPVFNSTGQVIRYDTVYVPRRDTVFTTTVQHDTVRTSRTTITPNITKRETLTTKLLQPNYRFFTVPVQLRYRLAAPGTSRLWTDVAVGAQFQFFLGGTQVVSDDGEHFRIERITAATSPFRTLNVALASSLALNYALTPRLSVSVAPSMRWQVLSLYKPETGLRQQATSTGLMFGVRFGL